MMVRMNRSVLYVVVWQTFYVFQRYVLLTNFRQQTKFWKMFFYFEHQL